MTGRAEPPRHTYQHQPVAVPMELAGLHASLPVGAEVEIAVPAATGAGTWEPARFVDVVVGAGFEPADPEPKSAGELLTLVATRARLLPDRVGPGMRLLLCGLNPSLYAADAGVGFARPGNRFWPAARRAGIVTRDRDPNHALRRHGIGMTDLVKRASVGAGELTATEYRLGLARLERLVEWLEPRVVCFVGLAGWRAAADRRARAGVIEGGFAGAAAYLMPNPSGLNAHSTVDDLATHLVAARRLANSRRARGARRSP